MTKYIKVNSLTSQITQLALFSKGYHWESSNGISYTYQPILCFGYSKIEKDFIKHSDSVLDVDRKKYEEVTLIELLKRKTLKDAEPFVWYDVNLLNNKEYKYMKTPDGEVYMYDPFHRTVSWTAFKPNRVYLKEE